MSETAEHRTILLADDDLDDRILIMRALAEQQVKSEVRAVDNGEELLDYLRRHGAYEDPGVSPRPSLILLDLNMPLVDGRAALREIKTDPDLRSIPVVILTTSTSPEDVRQCYEIGASAYVTKPISLKDLHRVITAIDEFWFKTVRLP